MVVAVIEELVSDASVSRNVASTEEPGEGAIPSNGEPFELFERGSIDEWRRCLHRPTLACG
jgi:hypothetical protein